MQDLLHRIYHFSCPKWEDLPNDLVLSSEAIEYIRHHLKDLIPNNAITKTMIQNYVKWGLIDKPIGRKYDRYHVAILIAITIYKEVLNLKDISVGSELQLKIMNFNQAYDVFAHTLEAALKRTFHSFIYQEPFSFEGFEAKDEMIGLTSVANAFALKRLSEIIIQSEGHKGLTAPKSE